MIYESEISIFNKDALKTKFGSIQTNFDVTLGKISAIISDSEIEEYISGHTTMNSKLSSVIQDVSGVHTQISSMQSDYEDGFQSVDSRLTTVDETIDGIRTEVSSVQSEYDSLETRVSSAEAKIEPSAIVATVRSSDSYKGDLNSKSTTYTGDYVPTTSNAPASTWNTTALKESHINDTFLTSSGELYQYISGHKGLMITFSSDSKTENARYDYVRIYYKIGDTTYVLPNIGGTDIAGASVFVPSNEFWLYWRSDRSVSSYGFRIADIKWTFSNTPTLTEATLPDIDPTETSGTNYPETTHPYTDNEEKFWKYTTSNTASVNPSYGWANREDSGIRTLTDRMSSAELKITDSAIISTVTETVGGKTALNSVIDQRADSIRLKADKISWSSTYSSMAEDGSLTVQSLTAKNYIYVNGDKRTYFRLPLYPLQNSLESQETYFEISNGGMVVKTYSAESKPGAASTEYVTTTFSNSSSLSNRTKAIKISCSANESFLEIGAFGFNSELKNGTKRYYTRHDWQGCSFEFYPSSNTDGHVKSTYSYNSCRIEGNIYVTGTKNRIVSTDDYSDRLLYCYETPSPLFGDIGEGEIGEDGKCYVWLDPVFSQTIRTSNYQVSLQSYSPSLTYVMERTDSYFIVGGEPGAKFGWEIKAKQADFAERRLDRFEEQREDDSVNYGLLASNHINELMEGRYAE